MKTEVNEGNFTITFPNLDQFYKECDIVEDTGNKTEWKRNCDTNNPHWIGLSKDEIIASKYNYKKGLDQLKELEADFNLGGSKRSYKWDESDGDDMNYDRFLDYLPCLSKRITKKGDGKGKVITIYVSIGENWNIRFEEMLNRSYTVMRLIDYLENLNYRTEIIVYTDVANLGSYKGEEVRTLHTEIVIKRAQDPLIKGLVLNCISPWMLRYHMFKFWNAKFITNPSYGVSYKSEYRNTKDKIYFQTGVCLNKESSDNYLKLLAKQFEFDE